MPKRKRNSPSTLSLVALLLAGAAGVVALATYVKIAPADKVRPEEHRRTVRGPIVDVQARSTDGQLRVPIPVLDGEGLRFESQPVSPPPSVDPRVWIVNRFLAETGITEIGAELLSLEVSEGTARLNFSDSFKQGQSSFNEALLVGGIRAALGQFPEIERVEFFAGGVRIEDFGHLDLTEPVSVIRFSDWARLATHGEAPPPSPEG